MFDRFTDDARKLMGHARQQSQSWKHDYIGTEHILLGMLELEGSRALEILRDLGASPEAIRKNVLKRLTLGEVEVTMGQIPFTPKAKEALEHSLVVASNWGHNYIGSAHLLVGLIRAGGIASDALAEAEVTLPDFGGAAVSGPSPEPPSADVKDFGQQIRELTDEIASLKARVAELERRLHEE